MVIAICTRILSGDEEASGLLVRRFEDIAAQNKDHQFYFISNKAVQPSSLPNVKSILIKQQSQHPWLWKWWYNYKLPAVLKKIKAGILISADAICSLKTTVPQCVIVNDLAFYQHPEWYSRQYMRFITPGIPAFLTTAKKVFTSSESSKKEILSRCKAEENKIAVIPGCSSSLYRPVSPDEKSNIKEQFTGGHEYFLFKGSTHSRNNLTNLLKAFSLFKKRQKSSMQLVLLTGEIPGKDVFAESLRLYKYRNEVKLITSPGEKETLALTAAAWCAVNLSPLYSDIFFLQQAIQCEVPVIAGNTPLANELLQDAALFASPAAVDSIAAQLMMIYKDENKHTELVENGKQLSRKNTGDHLWEAIISLAGTR